MNFVLKNVTTIGNVKSNNDGTMTQQLHIETGVVGCPYQDISAFRRVDYVFSENLTAKQIEEGIAPFAAQWVTDNYPNI
jgi:hypothetical protein